VNGDGVEALCFFRNACFGSQRRPATGWADGTDSWAVGTAADSVSYLLPPPFDSLAINLSLIGHFKPMVSGSVFVSDICYFVSLSLLALFLTTRRLAER